jgi:UDP-3-O-acyl-N-acetylglucosamine deacetylase
MAPDQGYGRILSGSEDDILRARERWARNPVDQTLAEDDAFPGNGMQTTLASVTSLSGPGTFLGKEQRRLRFEPSTQPGWAFDRTDLPTAMPIRAAVDNVWTTVRNIVLSSGSPHNYMRMVEHIVALKVGMGIDNVMIRMDSGDPPLFDRSSLDLVEALEQAGIEATGTPARYVTVKEPVTYASGSGGFLTFLPAEQGSRELWLDCTRDFRSAIGRQRIQVKVTPASFRHGAYARTNTTLLMMLYCKTVGKVFADVRSLGYSLRNILVAGRWRYINRPRLVHNGKSLEAVWHRAMLDLLAAIALIDRGRLAGRVISYKGGHALDVDMIRALYHNDLLEEL